MRPEHQEFADGVKLGAIAVISAILTATLVIGVGRNLLPPGEAAAAEASALTRAALR